MGPFSAIFIYFQNTFFEIRVPFIFNMLKTRSTSASLSSISSRVC